MLDAFLVVAQGDYSLNFCLQLTGKLDFLFLSQGMEKPSEICAFDFFARVSGDVLEKLG